MVISTIVHNGVDKIMYSKISTATTDGSAAPFYCKQLNIVTLDFYGFANDATYGYIAIEASGILSRVLQINLSDGTKDYATAFGVTYSNFRPMVINSVLYFYHSDSTSSITKMKYDFTVPDRV